MNNPLLKKLFSALAAGLVVLGLLSSTACEKRSLKVVFPEKYEQKKAAKEALESSPEDSGATMH